MTEETSSMTAETANNTELATESKETVQELAKIMEQFKL